MFFIGVFGIEHKNKEIGKISDLQCNICKNCSEFKVIKSFEFFHFFFIPILKWNYNYFLVCSQCNSIYEIPIEKGRKFENGNKVQFNYWDLKTCNNVYSNYNSCPYCGKNLESEFKYCPYCGKDIEK